MMHCVRLSLKDLHLVQAAAHHVRQPVRNVPALDDAFGNGVPIYKFQRTAVYLGGPGRAVVIAVK